MNHGNTQPYRHERWNPVTGCSPVSAGCDHCYARRIALRLQAQGVTRYAHGFQVTLHEDLIPRPLHWRKPRDVFVNSMSDLFHPLVPIPFLQRVFAVMHQCPHHRFMIITKRADRLPLITAAVRWPGNVRLGVTVENQHAVDRIAFLRATPAAYRFLCCEPLLGPIPSMDLTGIHHVIVGGETGPNARPMHPVWVDGIREQCIQTGTRFSLRRWLTGAATPDLPSPNEPDQLGFPPGEPPNLFTSTET